MKTRIYSFVLIAQRARVFVLICLFAAVFGGPLPVFALGESSGDTRLAGNVWGKNYFPNVELTTHEGQKVRFFDDLVKDKVVVINFIYTTCPDACPLETARLTEVKEILGDRVGKDVHFYSITIDPETDTPEVLADYAKRYQTGPGWLFLTADSDKVLTLRKKLGLYIDEIEKDPNDHNLSMIMGNQKTGRWMKRSPFENPYILATEIGSWLHNYKEASNSGNKYENAPKLRSLTQGESLFRTRCSVCHLIGTGDGLPRTGPNLFGVTERREPDWLRRWISEPDVMLAEKDSIAMGLFEAYNHVPMPNMRLNDFEVSNLIDFLETESRRVAKVESVEALAAQIDAEIPECCQKAEIIEAGDSELENIELGNSDLVLSNDEEESDTSCCLEAEEEASEEETTSTCCKDELENDIDLTSTPRSHKPMKTASILLGCLFSLLAVTSRRRED